MKSILHLYDTLKTSDELSIILDNLAIHVASRNMFPMTLTQFCSGDRVEGDLLSHYFASAITFVHQLVDKTILEDENGIDGDQYESLIFAVWFCKDKDSGVLNPDMFAKWLIAILLQGHMPNTDQYVESLCSASLLNELKLDYDKDLLVKISDSSFKLRKHGLILTDDKMVYPHQFMRRYYHSNFVNLLVVLNTCIDNGLEVKLRIDPLRLATHPRYCQNIFEADYWYGKPFSDSILKSSHKEELVTVHRSDDNFNMSYPVRYTVFRTSMMDNNLRQFMVEEYATTTNPSISNRKPPGFGQKYCIQKFAHFVYDQKSSNFCHVDGAVRTFKLSEYEDVFDSVTKSNDPGSKIGIRHKLFLVEGAIETDLLQELMYEYFMYNPHIEEYFSGMTTNHNTLMDSGDLVN